MYGDTNVVYIVFAVIGALLVVVPLPKAIVSGNVGTSMLILWTELANLLLLINAIRWNGNVEDWAPAWCDFCGYSLIAADIALVGTGVSINRRLYMIVTLDPRRYEVVFNALVDIVLCFVIPMMSMALEYVVQQYRYYIYEDIGCLPGIASVNLAFPLVWMLPALMGITSAGYACLTIRAGLRERKLRREPGTSLAWSRRLMSIGVVSAIYGLVPTTIAIALLATGFPVSSWPGWNTIHSTIDNVAYVPAQEWQSSSISIASAELRRWTVVSLAFVVFVILGLTADVKKMYRIPLRSIIDHVSTSQAGTIVIERNTDENSNDHSEVVQSPGLLPDHSCISLEKTLEEGRRESFDLTDGPKSDWDVESAQLTFPIPQAIAL